MILTCPACHTSYTVKDGAIPPQGRTVRCAACKHSWHQVGAEEPGAEAAVSAAPVASDEERHEAVVEEQPVPPEVASDLGDAADGAEPEIAPVEEVFAPEPAETIAEAFVAEPVVEEPVAEPVADDSGWNDAPYGDEVSAPRRKGLVIVLALVVLVAALAAAAYFLAPREWMARAGLAQASADSPLKLMVTSQTRQKLASGNDLVSLSGRVINPTDASEPVPALQADLRDGGGKLVYSWMIPPPAARLAPRASASFNAAELGVPANATSLTLRWAS
ncbi:zinc-ribbon domain-containing protein [Sphingomonas sp. RB1R13]|uniref:zinc-ribbon domain-containing protein n=1 Tax=Sphingomonas sp. RB1R13 TaxID=3096159 RepID=UPI002FCAED11